MTGSGPRNVPPAGLAPVCWTNSPTSAVTPTTCFLPRGCAIPCLQVYGLASQAVGPPGSNFEMSWENRTFPDIGKKMVSLKPLAKQRVHPQDSVLGALSRAQLDATGKVVGNPGLTIATYADMIRAAFQ